MKKSPFKKIVFTVIIALFIPIFSYTTFQFVQRNKDEEMIRKSYRRQLDSILFSINQHCWDVFRSWDSALETIVTTTNGDLSADLQRFLREQKPLIASFVRYSPIRIYLVLQDGRIARKKDYQKLEGIVTKEQNKIKKMIKRAREGYVKPIAVTWSREGEQSLSLLLFPVLQGTKASRKSILAGFLIDDDLFVENVVARKFTEINDGTFVFAVRDKDAKNIIYFSEETEDDFEKSEKLWLLPHLSLEIKMQGITLGEIAKRRTLTNLVFLAVVDIVLLLGVLYMLRNISHEMTLARLKTDFVANVSHELRTPLALIRMHAETLEMGRVSSDEKKQNYYHAIVAETTRLTQLINNILDFSQIESDKKEYHFAKKDLSELVRRTMAMYFFHLQQKGFQVNVNIDEHIPEIKMDAEAVQQAFMNLLDNAMKFSMDQKQIDVHLYQNSKNIILAVSDRGIGIPQQEQRRIFEKFYRVGSSLVHNTKGSGLGLSLVKYIMGIHNGRVIVKSRVGEGSTFSLVFPVDKSREA